MTYYFQGVLQYTPVQAGLASLPMTAGIFLAFPFATSLLTRLGAEPVMATGAFIAAGGLLLFARIGLEDAFWTTAFPAETVMGIGLGLIFVPLGNVALNGVDPHDAGAAGAVGSASQQVGGSLGTAALSAIALSAGTAYATSHAPTPLLQVESLVHGFQVGFVWGAGFLVVASVVVLALVRGGKLAPSEKVAVHIG